MELYVCAPYIHPGHGHGQRSLYLVISHYISSRHESCQHVCDISTFGQGDPFRFVLENFFGGGVVVEITNGLKTCAWRHTPVMGGSFVVFVNRETHLINVTWKFRSNMSRWGNPDSVFSDVPWTYGLCQGSEIKMCSCYISRQSVAVSWLMQMFSDVCWSLGARRMTCCNFYILSTHNSALTCDAAVWCFLLGQCEWVHIFVCKGNSFSNNSEDIGCHVAKLVAGDLCTPGNLHQ